MSVPPTGPTGVLVMAHGTPATEAGIEPFYRAIRRGSPPPAELLDELVSRYRSIGGISPLTERTAAQVAGIAGALESVAPGRFTVRFGTKYVSPFIEDGMAELSDAGVARVIGLVLTPHQSTVGSNEYFRRAEAAVAQSRSLVSFTAIPSWHRAEGLAALLAERTGVALGELGQEGPRRAAVFFTAHSVPERFVVEGDPYPAQVTATASDVAELLGLDDREGLTWGVAWQSAGRTADRWVGPDLLDEIDRVTRQGATDVVVCPVGFVSDHLEILYDLDIEADARARSCGLSFVRTASLNDDPRFMELLARVVLSASAGSNPPA